jgi:hypothetical protein
MSTFWHMCWIHLNKRFFYNKGGDIKNDIWFMFISTGGAQYGWHTPPASPKSEIRHLILLDRYSPKSLAGTQKLALVSCLNPFEFFLHCAKQGEVTGAKSGESGEWVWHAAHSMFFESICWSPTCVNWAITNMNHKLFLMGCPSSRKDRLLKLYEYIYYKIVAIHFGIIWKSVDNIEVTWIPHDRKHELFALNIKSRLRDHVISRHSLYATWWYIQEKSWFITNHKMMPAITLISMQE